MVYLLSTSWFPECEPSDNPNFKPKANPIYHQFIQDRILNIHNNNNNKESEISNCL